MEAIINEPRKVPSYLVHYHMPVTVALSCLAFVACNDGECKACSDADTCTECNTNYQLDPEDNECVYSKNTLPQSSLSN